MKRFVFAAAAAAVLSIASAASAATIYASSVISWTKATGVNQGVVNTNRNNTYNALGAPDSGVSGGQTSFYSLGQNKEIVLGFTPNFGAGPVRTWEVTFNGGNPEEGAEVFVALGNGPWIPVGVVTGRTGTNNPLTTDQPNSVTVVGGPFDRVKLVDLTGQFKNGVSGAKFGSQGSDGFDLDSVSVTAIPTPAALGGGLALLALMAGSRMRKQA